VTFPVGWALLAALASGFAPAAAILVCAALLCRMILQDEIDQRFDGRKHALWLGPVRDLFSFAIFAGSFLPGQVHWRGRDYAVGEDGIMEPVGVDAEAAEAEVA
jgi:ceramide glucosyltransferase